MSPAYQHFFRRDRSPFILLLRKSARGGSFAVKDIQTGLRRFMALRGGFFKKFAGLHLIQIHKVKHPHVIQGTRIDRRPGTGA